MRMVIPTLFGLEGIVADELRWKGFQGVFAENGRVFLRGIFMMWRGRISKFAAGSGFRLS